MFLAGCVSVRCFFGLRERNDAGRDEGQTETVVLAGNIECPVLIRNRRQVLWKLLSFNGGKQAMGPNSLKSFAWVAATATLILGGVSSANAYTIYTDRAAWEAAIPGNTITTDTFSSPIGSVQSITLDSGIVSTNSSPPILPNAFDNNSVSGGVYNDATQAGTGNTASNTITWVFPSAHVFAFGADFISAGLDRLTLIGNFDGTGDQTIVVYNTIGGPDGFLGVVGTAKFDSVVFGNNLTIVDSFSIDNASFAVPEPSTVLLVLMGAFGLFSTKRVSRGQGAD